MFRIYRLPSSLLLLLLTSIVSAQSSTDQPLAVQLEDFHRYHQNRRGDSIALLSPQFLEHARQEGRPIELAWAQYYYCFSGVSETPDTCQILLEDSRKIFRDQDDKEAYFKVTFILANTALINHTPKRAITYYEEILAYLKKISINEDSDKWNFRFGRTYAYLARAYAQLHDLDKAQEAALNSFSYINKTNDSREIINAAQTVGNIYYDLGKLELSRKYQRIALRMAQQEQMPKMMTIALNNLGSSFQYDRAPDSALHYFERSLKIEQELGDSVGMAHTMLQLAEVYTVLGNYELGSYYSQRTYELAKVVNDPILGGSAMLNQGEIAINREQYLKAIPLIDSAINLKYQYQYYLGLADAYELLHQAQKGAGDFGAALESFQLSTQLNDSLLNLEMRDRIERLETQFETAQKEQQIKMLSEQNKLQQAKFRQRFIALLAALLILLLTITLIVFYNRQQRLKQTNNTLEMEQRMLRAQMNPHFTFNALASIQTYLLKNGQAQKAAYYLSKFAKLIRQILEHSRSSFIPLSEELSYLENYLSVQQLRYDRGFTYQIQIASELDPDDILVPPMLIQPAVENSIEHGRVYTIENGEILINVAIVTPELLSVSVTDNGVGRQASWERTNDQPKRSVSTAIIEDRIELLQRVHHPDFGYAVLDRPNSGTQVTFHFPKT